MAIQLNPTPPVTTNQAPPVQPPAGFALASATIFPGFFTLQDSEIVDLVAIDFVTQNMPTPDALAKYIADAASQVASLGQEIEAYWLYQGPPTEVSIPADICLFGVCVSLPFAGTVVASMPTFRLYVLLRNLAPTASGQIVARPQVGAILAGGAVALVLLVALAGIIQVFQGKLKWSDISGYVKSTLPGGQAAEAAAGLSWPLFAFGFAIALGSIIAGFRSSLEVKGGPVTATVGSGPAPQRR